jgi:hypothetical protein
LLPYARVCPAANASLSIRANNAFSLRVHAKMGMRITGEFTHDSVRAVDLFNIPPENFVEVGRQIEI